MDALGVVASRPRCGALRRELALLAALGVIKATPATTPYRPERPCPRGCDCIALLLGEAVRQRETAAGALFLLEDWAREWPRWAAATFGGSEAVVREILGRDHRYLLCLRTPCSGDFSGEAAEAGRCTGLPVRWLEVGLAHLASATAPTEGVAI
jgi:hypothetical protein